MNNIEYLRDELWKLMYLSPISPSDLLENAKDPDYKSINFKHIEGGTEVELIFTDNGDLVKTNYIFKNNEQLQQIIMDEGTCHSIIYDRQKEIDKILFQINDLNASKNKIENIA